MFVKFDYLFKKINVSCISYLKIFLKQQVFYQILLQNIPYRPQTYSSGRKQGHSGSQLYPVQTMQTMENTVDKQVKWLTDGEL